MTQKEITPIILAEPYWEQQKGESSVWYRRFCSVRNQRGRRSALSAYRAESEGKGSNRRIPRNIPGSWERARVKFQWQERFEAWDKYQQEKEDQIWSDRLNHFRDRLWEISEKFLDKANAGALIPLAEQVLDNGAIVVKPSDWANFRFVVMLAESGSRLGQQAIGDANWALQLLTSKGFEVKDPTIAQDPSIYLEGSTELAIDNLDFADTKEFKELRDAALRKMREPDDQ